MNSRILAYVYPGWHGCPERDSFFPAGWSEWDLVYQARPFFKGHRQPNLPLNGRYDDSQPATAQQQVQLATEHGVSGFVYGFFWSRGKRVFEAALRDGFLGSPPGRTYPFALMWANRMPRRVLPIKKPAAPTIAPHRRVHTDEQDFLSLIRYLADHYFVRENYLRVADRLYLSIFDTSFFLRQLGLERAQQAIAQAKSWLHEAGLGGLHLAAIDPAAEFHDALAGLGFDSVTHYVLLPEWKGPQQQDYRQCANIRARQWPSFAQRTALPYFPSVSPGWDPTPRAADYGPPKPRRYPWSPIVTGSAPEHFGALLSKAGTYLKKQPVDPLLFIASWNEWSEGHYLEPDERFGLRWLEAVAQQVG